MKLTPIVTACILVATLGLTGATSAETAPAVGDLTSAERKADPRQERPVTDSAPLVYVGKLLEEASRQTGVAVAAGDAGDGAADFRVSVSLSKVPLGDVMSALWSLMSYRGAEWDWHRVQNSGGHRYQLLRGQSARALPARLAQAAETRFEEHAALMMRAAAASPDERARMVRENPAVAPMIGY
jgi:hypothetical protein